MKGAHSQQSLTCAHARILSRPTSLQVSHAIPPRSPLCLGSSPMRQLRSGFDAVLESSTQQTTGEPANRELTLTAAIAELS